MEQFLIELGLPALFLLSLLASSLLPLGSEWLLLALLAQGQPALSAVLVASLGNYLGALTTYGLGFWGSDQLNKRLLRLDDQRLQRARQRYARYGSWSLLFSWLPVVGDPLCFVAGTLRLPLRNFTLPVALGKFLRYAALAGLFSWLWV